jgi:hypothetical protein
LIERILSFIPQLQVIPVKKNEVVNSPPVNSRENSQSNRSFMTSTQSSSQQVTQEDWGSDESLDLSDIESSISTCSKDFTENKKCEDSVKPPPQPQVCVRKFPGPAGLISRTVRFITFFHLHVLMIQFLQVKSTLITNSGHSN